MENNSLKEIQLSLEKRLKDLPINFGNSDGELFLNFKNGGWVENRHDSAYADLFCLSVIYIDKSEYLVNVWVDGEGITEYSYFKPEQIKEMEDVIYEIAKNISNFCSSLSKLIPYYK